MRAIIIGFCYAGCEDRLRLPTGIIVDIYRAYQHAVRIGCKDISVITDYEANTRPKATGSHLSRPQSPSDSRPWRRARDEVTRHTEDHLRSQHLARLVASGTVDVDLDDFIISLQKRGELIRYVGRAAFESDVKSPKGAKSAKGATQATKGATPPGVGPPPRTARGEGLPSQHLDFVQRSPSSVVTLSTSSPSGTLLYFSGHSDGGDALLPHYSPPDVSIWHGHRKVDRIPLSSLVGYTVRAGAGTRSQSLVILDCCGPHETGLRYLHNQDNNRAILRTTGAPSGGSIGTGDRVVCIVAPLMPGDVRTYATGSGSSFSRRLWQTLAGDDSMSGAVGDSGLLSLSKMPGPVHVSHPDCSAIWPWARDRQSHWVEVCPLTCIMTVHQAYEDENYD